MSQSEFWSLRARGPRALLTVAGAARRDRGRRAVAPPGVGEHRAPPMDAAAYPAGRASCAPPRRISVADACPGAARGSQHHRHGSWRSRAAASSAGRRARPARRPDGPDRSRPCRGRRPRQAAVARRAPRARRRADRAGRIGGVRHATRLPFASPRSFCVRAAEPPTDPATSSLPRPQRRENPRRAGPGAGRAGWSTYSGVTADFGVFRRASGRPHERWRFQAPPLRMRAGGGECGPLRGARRSFAARREVASKS